MSLKGESYGYKRQTGTVKSITDNGDIFLTNGKILKLSSVMLNKRTISFLKESLIGNNISYWSNDNKTDRHNRINAQILLQDEWIQCKILQSGYSIAAPSPLSKNIAYDLYKCENQDAIKKYAVNTDDAVKFIGGYKIVSGSIYSTYQSKKNLYINFDKDWKTDFSIMISNDIVKKLTSEQLEKLTTKEQKIRVRGWIEKYNGPIIKLSDFNQIEFLEDKV
jgi:hypothetical protein